MNISRFIFSNIVTLMVLVSSLSCIDTKGTQAGHNESGLMTGGSTPKVLSREKLKILANELIAGASRSPCGSNALQQNLFKNIAAHNGVPYTQLAPLLRDLTDPESNACNGQSCSGPFGLQMYQVSKFLDGSQRAAALLNPGSPEVSILRSSLTQPPNGGVWSKPDISGLNTIRGHGTMVVYTYQKERDFVQMIGKKPDLNNHDEARSLAEALLLKKMTSGAEGNKTLRSLPDVPGNAMMGYGLYAATDPMQTTGFGEYLIEFEISLEAFYTYEKDKIPKKVSNIRGNQFGIIYPYLDSVSGSKAIVLRFDPEAHPLGQPVIPGSVRVYSNSYKKKYSVLDLKMIGEFAKKSSINHGNPSRAFMDRYGNHLNLQQSFSRFFMNSRILEMASRSGLIARLVHEILKRPQWVQNGLERLQKMPSLGEHLDNYIKSYGPKENFGDIIIKYIEVNLQNSGSLPSKITIAKAMDLVPNSFYTNSEEAFHEEMITHHFSSATINEYKDFLVNFYWDWANVIDYWKKNNIDAFVERSLRKTP